MTEELHCWNQHICQIMRRKSGIFERVLQLCKKKILNVYADRRTNIQKYLYLKNAWGFDIYWQGCFTRYSVSYVLYKYWSRYMYYTTKFNSSKILYFGTFSQQQHYLNRCHCCKFVNPQNLFYSNHSKKKTITDDYHDDQRVNGGWTLASIRENVFSGMRTYRFWTNLKWQNLYLDSYYLDLKNAAR